MSSTVWSYYSKDLLHHVALKYLVVGKFQGKIFVVLFVKSEKFGFFHLMHNNYMGVVIAQNMKYKLSFSITVVNNNPHIAI